MKEVKRTFTINNKLLDEFKLISKKNSKTYKQSVKEAIELWLSNNHRKECN